jgi:hypothetical protein
MRSTTLLLALSLALAATPATVAAHHPAPGGDPPKKERHKDHRGTHHLLHACVISDATATGMELRVLGGNRHMRDVLDGAETFSAKLDDATFVRLVGKARFLPAGREPGKLPRIGTFDDLDAGDRVIVRFRAKRGLDADELPAAFKVIDRGPVARCAPPAEEPPPVEEPPAGEL